MAVGKFRKTGLFILAVIATIAVAYILGVTAANLAGNIRAEKMQAEALAAILEQMGTDIAIGGALPDGMLEDLDGNPVMLSDVVCDKSLIAFFSPTCGYCREQLELFRELFPDPSDHACFIVISNAEPMTLFEMREENQVGCSMLHDPEGSYKSELGVFTFPFNLVVNRELIIENIFAGSPDSKDLEKIIINNRSREN